MLAIDGKPLDNSRQPYIIAEAASTHQHEKQRAKDLVYAAAEAGADAIKFQTYRPEELTTSTPLPDGSGRTLRDVLTGGLPREWHTELATLAHECGIAFLSTPFSTDAARFLVEQIHVPALKIASGDLPFAPLLRYATETGLPLIISTGMATLAEIQASVASLLLPAYQGHRLVLLHCISAYPCAPATANLYALGTLKRWFPYAAIGWSDHTLSVEVIPALAVALGASVIEKHFCLTDTDITNMDAGHSLEPKEFARMVRTLRDVGQSLGDGVKQPQACEQGDRLWARRGSDGLRPVDKVRAIP